MTRCAPVHGRRDTSPLASRQRQNKSLPGGHHEALADRIGVADRTRGIGAAGGAPPSPSTRCPIRCGFRPTCISARFPASRSIPRDTSSCCRAATPPGRPMPRRRRSSWSSTPKASSSARSARTSTPGRSATPSRSIRKDNIWVTDKGSDMVIKFDPEGRVAHGVRPQAGSLRRRHRPAETSEAAAAGGGRPVSPGHRRGLGRGRQHLHQRRLHQLARRQGRQGRQLAEVLGRPRQGARPIQHPALHRDRRRGQRLCRRPRQPAHSGVRRRRQIPAPFTIDVPVPPDAKPAIGNIPDEAMIAGGTWRRARRGRSASRRRRNQVLYSSDAWPGRIYKLSLDGKVLGVLGQSGKQLKQFGWIHAMACPSENVIYVAELLNWRVQKLILKP